MPIFEPRRSADPEEIIGSDAATRALSVTAVENDFVTRVYENITWVYDYTFGPTLHPGRVHAIRADGHQPGERILEVGVGTGHQRLALSAGLFGHRHRPVRLDARQGARTRRAEGIRNVRLLEMDAADLKFADGTFDIVYAPYLISVVPDPVAVAREMRRVCRPGGRIIFLNHFRSPNPILASFERLISPFTVHIGFKSDLDLPASSPRPNSSPSRSKRSTSRRSGR